MKKLLLFCCMALLCNSLSFTQGFQQGNIQPKLSDYVPSSPTAYSLGKYGDIPVNEATGMANINIPLYTFKTPNLSVPIELNYTTSGVKVGQIASWVGMGWNLNTGGVITRKIRGLPDEDATRNTVSYSTLMGWKSSPNESTRALYYNHIYNIANKASSDYVADIFTFNIDGYSGSFFLDNSMTPVIIKKQAELKITTIGNSFENGFIITTPQGIQYTFSEIEKTNQRMTCSPGTQTVLGIDKVTSWYLKKITHHLGDEITFTYGHTTSYWYNSSISQSYGENSIPQSSAPQGVTLPAEGLVNCATRSYVSGKVLTQITSNRNIGSVSFTSSLSRSDVNDYRLDEVVIKNPQDQQIKAFGFSYSQIQSSINYSSAVFPLRGGNDEKYRLFLNYVIEKDTSGSTVNGKKYSFEYNDPSGLPRRMSLAQDELGYYNGATTNTSFLPSTIGSNLNIPTSAIRDRSFDFNSAKKGILTKVTYPTKGYTSFVYETGLSAIRIKEVKSLAKSGGVEKIVKYYYTTKENAVSGNYNPSQISIGSGGYILVSPAISISNTLITGGAGVMQAGAFFYMTANQNNFYFERTEFTSTGSVPLYLTNAHQFLYSTVTVGYGNNFEGGGVEKKFMVNSDSNGSLMNGRIINNGEKTNSGYLNGLLLEETIFKKDDNSLQKIKQTNYTYVRNKLKSIDNYIGNIFFESQVNSADGALGVSGYDVNKIQTKGENISIGSITTKNYFGSNIVTIVQTNDYGNSSTSLAGLPIETITTDSGGDTFKSQYTYPSIGSTQRIQNRFEIVETKNYKGTTLLSHQKTDYKNWGNDIVLPEFVKTSKGGASLEDRIVFHNYDNKGNPIAVSKKDGTQIVYIWGYHQTKLIAKIENFTESQLTAIQSLVNTAVTASNADINSSTENVLRTALKTIRDHASLSNSQMTSFTYNPLIGVTSVTDPRGKTVYYNYDSFGRLQYVKDNEGNIVSENKYNYKN